MTIEGTVSLTTMNADWPLAFKYLTSGGQISVVPSPVTMQKQCVVVVVVVGAAAAATLVCVRVCLGVFVCSYRCRCVLHVGHSSPGRR